MTLLLETRGLSRSFGGLKAVSDVDFHLRKGEVRAVIGPNGAGKTTFVSLVSGRILPSAGTIHFEGQDITALPAFRRVQRGIAYTFQITSIYANLSAAENVALAAHRPGKDGPARMGASTISSAWALPTARRRPREPCPMAISGFWKSPWDLHSGPSSSSSTNRRRACQTRRSTSFIALVRDVAKEATVLLIEHNMPVVMDLAHRITVLDRGSILAEGTPAEIRANAAVQGAYLGTG